MQFLAAEMRTGRVLDYLPSLDLNGGLLDRRISTATSVDAVLALAGAPPEWERATKPLASWIACYDDTDAARAILWCGYPNYRNPSAATDSVNLSMVSSEGYLEERPVGDLTYDSGSGRDDAVTDMLNRYIIGDHGPDRGIALQLDPLSGAGPPLEEDLVLQNADNATVGSRIRALYSQYGGEFTIDWAFGDDDTMLVGTFRFGDRLGTQAFPGHTPSVKFYMPGQLVNFERPEDYSIGKGANKVVAYSTGSGDLVPYADPVYAPEDPDRPTCEYRYQPAPGISPEGLARYGPKAIKILGPGARAVKLTASLARTDGRRFGVDWGMGDELGYAVAPVPAFPAGVEGVGRAVGVQIDPEHDTISPLLAEKTVYVEST